MTNPYANLHRNESTGFWKIGRIPKAQAVLTPAFGIDVFANSLGYRSIEPDPSSPNKKVMFVGCSFTQGAGLLNSEMWTSVMVDTLNRETGLEIEQHNFGQYGHGADYFAMIVHQVLPILRPDLLVVLFTEPTRRSLFPEFDQRHPYTVHDGQGDWRSRRPLWKEFMIMQQDPTDFYHWVQQFHMIDYAAKANQTPWAWQTYVPWLGWIPELSQYVRTDNMSPEMFPDHRSVNDYARDGDHPGPITSRHFGESMARFALSQKLIPL